MNIETLESTMQLLKEAAAKPMLKFITVHSRHEYDCLAEAFKPLELMPGSKLPVWAGWGIIIRMDLETPIHTIRFNMDDGTFTDYNMRTNDKSTKQS